MILQALKIVIADDDPDDQELLQLAFQEEAPRALLQPFFDGQDMIRYLNLQDQANLPHLIILDYNMPTRGPEVLTYLKNHPHLQQIPALIWSTSSDPFFTNECLRKGAGAFYEKPMDYRQFRPLVRLMLRYCRRC